MDAARLAVATYLGASLDELELVQSTTIGLETAVEGLVASGYLKAGQVILTTDQEHAGGLAGYQAVLGVPPALHSPLMSATNAISVHASTSASTK